MCGRTINSAPQNIQAPKVNIAAGGRRVSVVVVYQSPRWAPAEEEEQILFLNVVAGFARKFQIVTVLTPWILTGFARQSGRHF